MKRVMTMSLSLSVMLLAACSKVPAGNVGVKFQMYGDDKGALQELPPGRYWVGWGYEMYTFPTFTQTYTFTRSAAEGRPLDESISFQTAQGLTVNADVGITYHIDPAKVTLIGQSAGALSVASLIFSPQAKGLFRSATMTSWCNYRDAMPTLAEAEATGMEVQKRLKADSLSAMRAIPADRILAIQSESQVGANVTGVRIGGPIVDGFVLPDQKPALLTAGRVNRVPIIASSNTDDIDIGMSPFGRVMTLDDYRGVARTAFGADADAFLNLFPATDDASAKAAARRVAHMAGFVLASRQCARDQASLGQATYIDEFSRKHPYTPGVRFADQDPVTVGAYHTGDIPYWLGTLDVYNLLRRTRDWTPYDRQLSATMMADLIGFAWNGRPGPDWPAWSVGDERERVFGDNITVRPLDRMRLDWLEAHPVARTAPAPRPISPRD